ncbi:MAG: transglycosylase SLT domain-containing protein [Desulfofustis sp. PB-SRB1]|jgi:membrane-bound lytic murein transglycosylase D|nr:transglycosylase SLT domain-containing protein [Desulfofustis sp. PB-SRB1]MBM1002028.1 transglycosylase SLT domain-containing protein [Desulfofustis sp. PB-SRB1]HBH28256.1 lytic transglycosylase [Desulfofustis sp.]HBH31088.1 lytic transglycosylase [Desulfofustis sp.]
MITFFRNYPVSIILLLSLLAGGGCSKHTGLTGHGEMVSDPAPMMADSDGDQPPELLETEVCLNQELAALEQTGDWEAAVETAGADDAVSTGEPVAVVTYDFPIMVNRQVQMYLDLFSDKQQRYFKRWLARSGRYLPMMQEIFTEYGLPGDLVYLAMIESGFNQKACSPSRAVGLWQFMAPTGKQYGMQVTRYLDERRDAEKSTRAAAAYLRDLYDEFGDWYIAVAAYNGGPGTMRKAMHRANSDDFWKIAQKRYIKLETKRYVPKLIAAIMIAKQPQQYGFTDVTYEAPLAYETFAAGPGLSLKAAALLSESSLDELAALNPELLKNMTPPQAPDYQLKVPVGTASVAEANLPHLHQIAAPIYQIHVVKKGETLSHIAARHKVSTDLIVTWNGLPSAHKLSIGQELTIIKNDFDLPLATTALSPVAQHQGTAIVLADQKKTAPKRQREQAPEQWYLVKNGDNLWTISRQFNTSPAAIKRWNNLTSNRIYPGKRLLLRDV